MNYKTQIDPNVIENHKKEVDMQILLSGSEKIKLSSKDSLNVFRDYSDHDDCQFYKKAASHNSKIILTPDYMGVFFNQDIHHPQFAIDNNKQIIKK